MSVPRKDTSRQMKLGAFVFNRGHHIAGWRSTHTGSDKVLDPAHYVDIARTAERGKFDMIFCEDGLAWRGKDIRSLARQARASIFEPLTLLAYLAANTSRIGLVATASTTFNEPFHVARKFASLDHLSGGRAGWNLVTSLADAEAANFGQSGIAKHADRYERAEEFIDVVLGLWSSWEDDAIVIDRESGIFHDYKKIKPLNHKGKHFDVAGPLNISRSPQGYPVIVQAGASDAGKKIAARTAEVVFVSIQNLKDSAEFYKDLKDRMPEFGRSPDELKIMPGISPVVGRTEKEAREKYADLASLDPSRSSGLAAID